MRKPIAVITLIATSLVLAACSSQPNQRLEEARESFNQLQNNPKALELAPLETKDAEAALKRADKAASGSSDTSEVNHLAYLVNQRVALANHTIALKDAEQQFRQVSNERAQVRLSARDAQIQNREAELQSREAQLRAKEQEIQERDARILQLQEELDAKSTERGSVVTFGDVLFDLNKADLKSAAMANIQRLAAVLQEQPERKILVEGFTDSTGSDSYNLQLSQQRADSVRHALVAAGIDPARITTAGLGKAHPVSDNDTPASRAMNRRVEVT
ncbi:MAG: OmpA family protein, partial [Porticoccaceae bacterium]|nr:OmpA family protein [Porticoccaceae bacterium]